jgi:hypothetical protein
MKMCYLIEMFWTSPTFLGLFEYAEFGELLFINDVNLNPFDNIGPGYENASTIGNIVHQRSYYYRGLWRAQVH